MARYDPVLTYGRLQHPRIEPFRPYYVLYDRIILTFHGFFRQKVLESATVQHRIRYVNVMYFLEDDTITVMEPPILVKQTACKFSVIKSINQLRYQVFLLTLFMFIFQNCGYPQGRIVRRSRIPKNPKGDFITWKDLNIGIDLKIFGIVYHLTDCDKATRV